MIKLLVTSVGSLVGQNLLDVIEVRSDDIRVIGTTALATMPLHRCERVYLVPMTEFPPSAFCERLLEIIDCEQPDLIIPARDRDVTVLAALAAQHPQLVDRIPCGSPDTAAAMEDKWLSYLFARDHNLAFAESAVADSKSGHEAVYQLAETVGFPLVAKPRMGFGSRQVLLLTNAEQLEVALTDQHLLVQRFIGRPDILLAFQNEVRKRGQPLFYSLEQSKYSVQTYVYRDGRIGTVCCTLNRMENGLSVAVERLRNDSLANLGQEWGRAFARAGWRGPLNIQCQQDGEGKFIAFELNGRFTGATAARYYLGHDELGCLLQDRLDRTTSSPPSLAGHLPLKFHRTLGVSGTDVEVLTKQGVWDRPHTTQRDPRGPLAIQRREAADLS